MAKSKIKRKRAPKSVLNLPDLEQSKSAVLNSLTSPSSQRTYDHAIREFIEWYCSEPRLAFNKTLFTRCRISLEQQHYASTTINLRLAAVRSLAYEAADCELPERRSTGWDPSREGCQTFRYAGWQLAVRGAGKATSTDRRRCQSSRQARLRHARHSPGLRPAAHRIDGVES